MMLTVISSLGLGLVICLLVAIALRRTSVVVDSIYIKYINSFIISKLENFEDDTELC